MRRVSTEQPWQRWGFQKRRDAGCFCQDTALTVQMFSENLLFVFAYKITTTTISVFQVMFANSVRATVPKSRRGREQARHWVHTFPPFPSPRNFPKLSLRAELLRAGEQVTLYISMTSTWLSLLYTLISRDTDLEVSYLLFCVKTMECCSTAKSWFPFPDINHFTLTLHQKKKKGKQNTNKNNY